MRPRNEDDDEREGAVSFSDAQDPEYGGREGMKEQSEWDRVKRKEEDDVATEEGQGGGGSRGRGCVSEGGGDERVPI